MSRFTPGRIAALGLCAAALLATTALGVEALADGDRGLAAFHALLAATVLAYGLTALRSRSAAC